MCNQCDSKAREIDQRLPHFIDGLHSVKIPEGLKAEEFLAAVKEYRHFVMKVHPQ